MITFLRSAVILLLAATGVLVAASSRAETPETLRIGAILATSGPASVFGAPAAKALRMLVEQLSKMGGIAGHPPGSLAVPWQIVDYTSGRDATFFDGDDAPVTHVDFTGDGWRQSLLDTNISLDYSDWRQAIVIGAADGGLEIGFGDGTTTVMPRSS